MRYQYFIRLTDGTSIMEITHDKPLDIDLEKKSITIENEAYGQKATTIINTAHIVSIGIIQDND